MYESSIVKSEFHSIFSSEMEELSNEIDFISKYALSEQAILDVGSGDGVIAFSLAKSGLNVVSVEPDGGLRTILYSMLKFSNTAGRNLTIIPSKLEQCDLVESFSLVLCLHVLPHVGGEDQRIAFIRNLSEKVKPMGHLILSFPISTELRKPSDEVLVETKIIGDITYRKYTALERIGLGRWLTTWRFTAKRSGKLITEYIDPIEFNTFSLDELKSIFLDYGLKVRHEFCNLQRDVFDPKTSKAAYLVLQKES